MSILSVTKILINGEELKHYINCSLHQEIGQHHILNLHCSYSYLASFCSDDNGFKELLGATIIVNSTSFDDFNHMNELNFRGIITGVNYSKGIYASSENYVSIKAKSSSIITDDGPHYTSHTDLSFTDIINNTFSGYDTSRFGVDVSDCKSNSPLPYIVQYNESSFKFAQRLASRYGEWLYYDGENLKFGIDTSESEIELILGRDLMSYSSTLQPIPRSFKYYTNDYLTNKNHDKSSESLSNSASNNLQMISDSSSDIYPQETRFWIPAVDSDQSKSELDTIAELQNNAITVNQIKLNGKANNLDMWVAKKIKIEDQEYRITKMTHSFNNEGEYENHFEAVSASIDTYPYTNISAYPRALSQTAKVVENNDPNGLGRVKVQFHWQKEDGLTTPWIRVLSPSASKGQGFFFIPEVDDEVLVDFEGDNAEIPYVVAGIYNSDLKPPDGSANSSNHIKMLQTRSGSKIILNDEDGSVTINDKSGSAIIMDGDGSITISAVKNLTINTGEKFIINTTDSTELNSGKEVVVQSSEDTKVAAGTNIEIEAGTNTSVTSGAKTEVSSPNIEATGQQVKVEGTMVDINGQGMVNIKGGMVNLN